MNRTDVVKELARRCSHLDEKDIAMLIKELTQVIGDALARGEPVAIHDLGRFVARRQCKRRGRNPSNGEEIFIPDRMVPKFRATDALRAKVAGRAGIKPESTEQT